MDVDFEVETAVQSGIDNTQNPEEEQQQQQQQQHTTAESATLPGIGSRKRRKQFDHVRPGTLTKFLCIDEEAMEEYSKGKENFRAKRRAEAESMIWKMTSYQSLTALPSDVHDNWMIKPYPRGRRCFIVAHRGMTFAVNTSGKVWQEFRSTLPGGTEDNSKDGSSLLDCICVLAGKEKRFYILDTLYWKGYDWEQYTAETRQYWLETVVAPELSPSYSEKSRFTFIPLKTIPTSDLPQLLHNPETYFAEKWSDITLDGLVISHKQSQYDTSNPLVFWAAWPLNFAEAVSQDLQSPDQSPVQDQVENARSPAMLSNNSSAISDHGLLYRTPNKTEIFRQTMPWPRQLVASRQPLVVGFDSIPFAIFDHGVMDTYQGHDFDAFGFKTNSEGAAAAPAANGSGSSSRSFLTDPFLCDDEPLLLNCPRVDTSTLQPLFVGNITRDTKRDRRTLATLEETENIKRRKTFVSPDWP